MTTGLLFPMAYAFAMIAVGPACELLNEDSTSVSLIPGRIWWKAVKQTTTVDILRFSTFVIWSMVLFGHFCPWNPTGFEVRSLVCRQVKLPFACLFHAFNPFSHYWNVPFPKPTRKVFIRLFFSCKRAFCSIRNHKAGSSFNSYYCFWVKLEPKTPALEGAL